MQKTLLMKKLTRGFLFDKIEKHQRGSILKILDVGCGNGSISRIARWFPNAEIDGVTLHREELTAHELSRSRNLHFVNLEIVKLSDIFFEKYDLIIMSHFVEHVTNSQKSIEQAISLLEIGGMIYLETPSEHSDKLPSMRGTLNFFDDPTHVRKWKQHELATLFQDHGAQILDSGVRRQWRRVFLLPMFLLIDVIKWQPPASSFWDLFGFAQYIIGRKQG